MSDCRFDVDVAPWVLGALDDASAAQFAVHLRSCHACSQAVARYSLVVDQLPMAAPQVEPRAELKELIMAEVRDDPRAASAAVAAEPAPGRRRRRWAPASAPAVGLAALLIAIGVGGGTLLRGGGDDDEARTVVGTTTNGAEAKLVVEDGGHATLVLDRMPRAPAGHVYQVWLAHGKDAPRPTRIFFTVQDDGCAHVRIGEPLADGERVLVTAEPRGGSTVPSSAPVIATPS